ncbi:hypothetical protein PC9H_011107 [Pleurotus ostreatus]|uniref:Histone deacetylase domain-containing protein n=2 Tax=Pleurotus TaxID=5320 RepID=A0A8H6ZPZ4_PLEOS|nr:uncharacterized protein PC9H_011107 [Pleurotus ostreatus]KAF7422943.1 hypothetical protein PC9H_011107 [Pleurotus ostreatus]KAG9227215.1 hypothetical protein CCMSSC00406_0004246 [Pleurotus cornucopiae]
MPSPEQRPTVFLQNACYEHQYIRSKDSSLIVERPERLRAVNLGLAAAIARLGDYSDAPVAPGKPDDSDASDLADALSRIDINRSSTRDEPVNTIRSSASVQLMNNPALKFIHGDIDGDKYLENLTLWIKESRTKIANDQSEIPDGLSQGDLYLCPGTLDAIQGALGTVCEAVDTVVNTKDSAPRAFVAIRPPGHHCGEDTPSGFCFVNNVAVAAAHAHLNHGVNRVVIFDIDLHHGNGTQSIAWQINEETYRKTIEAEAGASAKPGPQIYYGSIHDILSYPCEDGKPELVQAASVSIHGNHGQYIENIHLEEYTSEDHFWNDLYPNRYKRLFSKAKQFLDSTGGPGDDVMVFISCGFDACEHEYSSMSRHNRKVPTSFYYQFARDAIEFSDRYARGRLVSVLEGGYSDRALTSGTLALLCGLVGGTTTIDQSWWKTEHLEELEKAAKKKRGGRQSLSTAPQDPWLARTMSVFSALEAEGPRPSKKAGVPVPISSRTLRERKTGPASNVKAATPTASKPTSPAAKSIAIQKPRPQSRGEGDASSLSSLSSQSSDAESGVPPARKLPKVILRLGPKPEESS